MLPQTPLGKLCNMLIMHQISFPKSKIQNYKTHLLPVGCFQGLWTCNYSLPLSLEETLLLGHIVPSRRRTQATLSVFIVKNLCKFSSLNRAFSRMRVFYVSSQDPIVSLGFLKNSFFTESFALPRTYSLFLLERVISPNFPLVSIV